MTEFVNKSRIKKMEYIPWLLSLNCHLQVLIYAVFEIINKLTPTVKYEREMFNFTDGGVIALDWYYDKDGGKPLTNRPKPILALVGGLCGGNNN